MSIIIFHILTAFVIFTGHNANAFANHGPLLTRSSFQRENINKKPVTTRRRPQPLSLDMSLLDGAASLDLASPLVASFAESNPALLLASASVPFVEAEILSDAAHVALDMAAFLDADSLTLRIVSVIGRFLSIASDYVPDHSMLPEEFIFQGIMLWFSVAGLIKVIAPMVRSQKENQLTIRDRKCFVSLFRPAGIDWMQYKLLRSVAMEWEEVKPGDIITNDDDTEENLYWSYSNDIVIKRKQGDISLTVPPTRTSQILGNLDIFSSGSSSRSSKTSEVVRTTTHAGKSGATVLCMNKYKLKELMGTDASLDRAIRDIMFGSMQERLSSLLLVSVAAH